MLYPSLFDSFFAPTRVIVVSEERLQAAERKAKQEQIEAVETRIDDLTQYRDSLTKELAKLNPVNDVNAKETADCDV